MPLTTSVLISYSFPGLQGRLDLGVDIRIENPWLGTVIGVCDTAGVLRGYECPYGQVQPAGYSLPEQ